MPTKTWANVRTVSETSSPPHEGSAREPSASIVLPGAAEPLREILRSASLLVLRHPVAAQALFSALITEGRQFAQTADGQRWRSALIDSDLIRQGRALWEASVLNMLEDDPATILPSSIVDAIVQTTRSSDLMEMLQHIYQDLTGSHADAS